MYLKRLKLTRDERKFYTAYCSCKNIVRIIAIKLAVNSLICQIPVVRKFRTVAPSRISSLSKIFLISWRTLSYKFFNHPKHQYLLSILHNFYFLRRKIKKCINFVIYFFHNCRNICLTIFFPSAQRFFHKV